jgi:hypothetical protein
VEHGRRPILDFWHVNDSLLFSGGLPNFELRLAGLKDRIHRRAYRAQPSRRVYIAKPDDRERPLGIAALRTRSSGARWPRRLFFAQNP